MDNNIWEQGYEQGKENMLRMRARSENSQGDGAPMCSPGDMGAFLLGIYLGKELLGHRVARVQLQ